MNVPPEEVPACAGHGRRGGHAGAMAQHAGAMAQTAGRAPPDAADRSGGRLGRALDLFPQAVGNRVGWQRRGAVPAGLPRLVREGPCSASRTSHRYRSS
jgi:hypothetical protein